MAISAPQFSGTSYVPVGEKPDPTFVRALDDALAGKRYSFRFVTCQARPARSSKPLHPQQAFVIAGNDQADDIVLEVVRRFNYQIHQNRGCRLDGQDDNSLQLIRNGIAHLFDLSRGLSVEPDSYHGVERRYSNHDGDIIAFRLIQQSLSQSVTV